MEKGFRRYIRNGESLLIYKIIIEQGDKKNGNNQQNGYFRELHKNP